MKLAKLLMYAGVLALLAQSSCKSPTDSGTTGGGGGTQTSKIKGTVQRSDNGLPIFGAVVRDLSGLALPDTSKSPTGGFTLTYQLTGDISTRIAAVASGYSKDTPTDTLTVSVKFGDTTGTATLVLGVDSTSPPPGVATTGKAANIVQVGGGSSNISIRGTGANESTPITFEVRDSLGIPITVLNSVLVSFSILGGPGGGEYVFPATALTDDKGRVSTRITSGTRAGVLQLYASARNDSVKSSPIKITISGGLPDPSHFSLSSNSSNIPGGAGLPNGDNQKATFTVLVGDRFGNPVQAGTAVYFTTTGGVIQATSSTSASGTATAELSSGNPRPVGGIAVVTARTIGDSGTTISANLPITFSGPTNIIVPPTAFAVPDSGSYTLSYQVQDQYGNPLSPGTNIKVTVSGAGAGSLTLENDVDVTLPDTRDTNFTNFSVKIVDRSRGGASGPILVKIEVKSPNNFTGDVESKEVQGLVLSSGGGGGGGGVVIGTPTADRMGIVSVSKNSIIVNDGSASDKSLTTVTFDVRDSVGNLLINPLNPSAAKVYVTFQVIPSDGVLGGANLLIPADSTNEFAQVSTKLLSGTKSGVFTIKATTVVTTPPKVVSASTNITIRSGPPDPAHFALAPERYNFPALERISESLTDGITVSLADQFSNPIEAGTQVYFDATNLAVDPVATTNGNGFASVRLYAAGKKPIGSNIYPGLTAGLMRLRARTVNLETGAEIRDSILLVVTGQPVITLTSGPATYNLANGGSAGPWTFTVVDQLGNPMSGGTSISASAPGGAVDGANLILPDARTGGARITTFTINLRDADATTINNPPINGFLTVTVTHPVYGSFSLDLASGSIQ